MPARAFSVYGSRFLALLALALVLWGCNGIAFSPDGKKLVFPWKFGAETQLALLDLETNALKPLPGTIGANFPWFAPDGNRVAFTTDLGSLKLHNVAAGRTREIAPDSVALPIWTDAGRQLAYFERREGSGWDVVRYDVPSGKEASRVRAPGGVEPTWAAWVPRTSALAFVGKSGNRSDVYLSEFGQASKLTTTGDVIGVGASPDGNAIVWARKSRNAKYILLSLYRFDMQSRSVKKLAFPDRISLINPNPRTGPDSVEGVLFSPDLTRMIVYVEHWDAETKTKSNQRLYAMRISGEGAVEIARGSQDEATFPAWSWDSQKIALRTDAKKISKVILLNADGSGRKALRTQKVED